MRFTKEFETLWYLACQDGQWDHKRYPTREQAEIALAGVDEFDRKGLYVRAITFEVDKEKE